MVTAIGTTITIMMPRSTQHTMAEMLRMRLMEAFIFCWFPSTVTAVSAKHNAGIVHSSATRLHPQQMSVTMEITNAALVSSVWSSTSGAVRAEVAAGRALTTVVML